MEVPGRQVKNVLRNTGLQCDPCGSTGETQTAEHFCTECNEYLCSECTKVHRKLKATREHQLFGKDDMPQEKPTFTIDMNCRTHENYPFDYFCEGHDQLCCSVCLNIEHRECSIRYVSDLSDTFEKSEKKESILQKLNELEKEVKDTKSKSERNVQNVKCIADTILNEVEAFRAEINALLDDLQRQVLEKAKGMKDEDIHSMNDLSSELSAMQNQLSEHRKTLEIYSKLNKKKELTVATKFIEKEVMTFEKKIRDMSIRNNIRDIKFSQNEDISQLLHSVMELGSLEDREYNKSTKKEQTRDAGVQQSRKQQQHLNVSHVKDIAVRHKKDRNKCNITGIVVIDSNKIALADNNNSCVKIIDIERGIITSYLELEYPPWDITYVDSNRQLIVTVQANYKKFLVFLDVDETLIINKKVKVGAQCRGIDYFNDMIVVSYTPSPYTAPPYWIQFLNLDGQILKSVQTDESNKFLFPFYLKTSINEQAFYVSDMSCGTLTKLDKNLFVTDVYRRECLKEPRGVAVDRYENVYIAGLYSNNICVLSAGDRELKPVLNIELPQSIAVLQESDRMVVSHKYMDTISIFKLFV